MTRPPPYGLLLLGVPSGLIGLGFLTLVAASLFSGGPWGARLMLGFVGVGALFVSIKLLKYYVSYVRRRHSAERPSQDTQ